MVTKGTQQAPDCATEDRGTNTVDAESKHARYSRRRFFSLCAGAGAAVAAASVASSVSADAETTHRWSMGIDIEKCIGCGRCVAACRVENDVPEGLYRTWVEHYVITKDGQTHISSPSGGEFGFPTRFDPEDVRRSFFVPKLCNHCEASACTQVCPVGATFTSPDGLTLVDSNYCIGCGYCVQACPYGCRFINPDTNVADKCTMCYHRISRGQLPACVEVCPTGARIFGDLNELAASPDEMEHPRFVEFMSSSSLSVLKPELGTRPVVFYRNLDGEVS